VGLSAAQTSKSWTSGHEAHNFRVWVSWSADIYRLMGQTNAKHEKKAWVTNQAESACSHIVWALFFRPVDTQDIWPSSVTTQLNSSGFLL
jgi:hypothetical protein